MTDAVKLPTAEQIDAVYRDVWSTVPHANRLTEFARKIAALAIMQERERCAAICDAKLIAPFAKPEYDMHGLSERNMMAGACAAAIRAQPEIS